MDILSADLLDWLVEEDDKQHSEDLPIHTRPFAVPKTERNNNKIHFCRRI